MNPSTGRLEAMPESMQRKEDEMLWEKLLKRPEAEAPLQSILATKGPDDVVTPEELAATDVEIPKELWAVFQQGERMKFNGCVFEVGELSEGSQVVGMKMLGYDRQWLRQVIKKIRYEHKRQQRGPKEP